MVVIESPNTMTACRLQHILYLYSSHKSNILVEDLTYQLLQLAVLNEAQSIQGPTEEHKGHFVTCTIVNPDIRAPRFLYVSA